MKKHDIEINISEGDSNPIPIKKVVSILSGFQEMVYSVAEMKAKLSRSKPGPKSKSLQDVCELVITKVEGGSATFHIQTQEPEITLFGEDMFGMETLETSQKILESIARKDIKNLVYMAPDVNYRDKIIGKAQKFLPSAKSKTMVSIKSGQKPAVQVRQFEAKEIRDIMLPKEKGIPIDRGYSKPADVRGIAHFDSTGNFDCFDNILEVNDLPGILISFIDGKQFKYNFKTPIFFDIHEEGEHLQIIKQKDFGIVTTAYSGEEILNVIGEEFDLLWHEFVEAEESALHESGVRLKEKLLNVVYNREII